MSLESEAFEDLETIPCLARANDLSEQRGPFLKQTAGMSPGAALSVKPIGPILCNKQHFREKVRKTD